ncbi:MAG: penicillin-insensitive murein endopeptidase [Candidatus Tectomicrobia bacterium]|nr:penicillin-insensitive murein endopeptidase [Candidatus Tectomicrobia bacterium]
MNAQKRATDSRGGKATKLLAAADLLPSLNALPAFETVATVSLQDDSLPLRCVNVPEQGQACELPHHNSLPSNLKGMYSRANIAGRGQHWGRPQLVEVVLNVAYNWWKNGNTTKCLIADLSAQRFRDSQGHATHRAGEDADFDLANTLPADENYNPTKQQRCAMFVAICLAAGASRVLFSDAAVVNGVNKWAKQQGIRGRAKRETRHNNHFHLDI